jgi:thiol-disulfide isomerase/thioredoxin
VDAAGLQAALDAQRGHPVFVNFWASWCEPCMDEFPELVRAARGWRPRGIRFVSVSADDPADLAPVRKTIDRFGGPFDALLVASGDTDDLIRKVDAEWTGALPASFLYSAGGKQLHRLIGPIDRTTLEHWLSEASTNCRPSQ